MLTSASVKINFVKIAVFTDLLIPPLGGIEQYVFSITTELANRSHEVRVFAPGPLLNSKNFDIRDSRFEFERSLPLPFIWPSFRLTFPLHLYSDLKKWKPDVVHFQTAGPLSLNAILCAKKLKIKTVGTFHSYFMTPEYLATTASPKILIPAASQLLWRYAVFFYNLADAVISPSNFVAADLKAHGLTKPVVVIRNGVDLSAFGGQAPNERTRQIREELRIDGPCLLYIGRLSKEKNVDILIKACALYSQKIDRLTLILIGGGPEEVKLKNLAVKLGIDRYVRFLGQIEHKDLADSGIYEVGTAFVTASTSENQPLTILEAMAKGLPVIGVCARGVSELISGNGYLAEPNNPNDLSQKIEALLEDKNKIEEFSQKSKTIAEEYSLASSATNLIALYRKLDSSRGSPTLERPAGEDAKMVIRSVSEG